MSLLQKVNRRGAEAQSDSITSKDAPRVAEAFCGGTEFVLSYDQNPRASDDLLFPQRFCVSAVSKLFLLFQRLFGAGSLMKQLTAAFFFMLIFYPAFSQEIKHIKPIIGDRVSYTKAEHEEWHRIFGLMDKIEAGEVSYTRDLTEHEKELIEKLEMNEGPFTIGTGCSWYCGGGPHKVTASFCLDSVKYSSSNIHDFNLFTGWVEGKAGYGIGEYVEFFFEPHGPRLNKLIVYNGYFKNELLWQANSRLKQAKLYINGKLYAYLDFTDTPAPQSFSVEPVRSDVDGEDLVLRLEITDVYPGTKYEDVVISEINFDGLDVHCFAEGMMVFMADGSRKNIEDVVAGDEVLGYDKKTGGFHSTRVTQVAKALHEDLIRYTFRSGKTVTCTSDHPFLLSEESWASLDPAGSANYKGFENINTIQKEDLFITSNGEDQLVEIEVVPGERMTYTITGLDKGDNFVVEGFVVGVEKEK